MVIRRILLLCIWLYTYIRWPATSTQLLIIAASALAVYLGLNLAIKLKPIRRINFLFSERT